MKALFVFAQRTAPVQISYLGYPDITGLKTIDYRLTDHWADPEKSSPEQQEKLIQLAQGFLCYDPIDTSPSVNDSPCTKSNIITFGSFNNLPKINSEVIRVWSKILHAIPTSELLLKTKGLSDKMGRDYIMDNFAKQGIDPQRIKCAGYVKNPTEHLTLYNRIDIALDTFPYNGTTTTCEALWMGVPVITLAGQWHAARVGVSLLTGVSLENCIAQSIDEYINCAINLSQNFKALNKLRGSLRETMQTSRLMNKSEFVKQLEVTYRSLLLTD